MFAVVPESDDVSGAFELRSDALQLKFMVSCPRRRNQGLSAADANGSHAVVIAQLRDVGKRWQAAATFVTCAAYRCKVRVTHPADVAARFAPSVAVRSANLTKVIGL